jgi:hypothetical protein
MANSGAEYDDPQPDYFTGRNPHGPGNERSTSYSASVTTSPSHRRIRLENG